MPETKQYRVQMEDGSIKSFDLSTAIPEERVPQVLEGAIRATLRSKAPAPMPAHTPSPASAPTSKIPAHPALSSVLGSIFSSSQNAEPFQGNGPMTPDATIRPFGDQDAQARIREIGNNVIGMAAGATNSKVSLSPEAAHGLISGIKWHARNRITGETLEGGTLEDAISRVYEALGNRASEYITKRGRYMKPTQPGSVAAPQGISSKQMTDWFDEYDFERVGQKFEPQHIDEEGHNQPGLK